MLWSSGTQRLRSKPPKQNLITALGDGNLILIDRMVVYENMKVKEKIRKNITGDGRCI